MANDGDGEGGERDDVDDDETRNPARTMVLVNIMD